MDCIFCKLAHKEIPTEVIYEDEMLFAFYDANPVAPVHFLVIPKKHIASLDHLTEGDEKILGHMMATVASLAKKLGLDASGYRVVNNCGADGGQTVGHLHLHVIGGRSLQWHPG